MTVAFSRRRAAAVFATLLALTVLTVAAVPAASASATKSCGEKVIEDWFVNHGTIRAIYPLHCYRDAIKALSTDLKVYSEAEADIRRAMLYAQQHKPDPGPDGDQDTTSSPGTGTGSGPSSGGGVGPGSSPLVDTAGPSAIPIPVIVLAGVATLLLVLGAVGFVARRTAARRAGSGES